MDARERGRLGGLARAARLAATRATKQERVLTVRMDEEMHEAIRVTAMERGMSMRAWMINAARAQLNREGRWAATYKKRVGRHLEASAGVYKSGWPVSEPCFLLSCGKMHDPAEHADVTMVELRHALADLSKGVHWQADEDAAG